MGFSIGQHRQYLRIGTLLPWLLCPLTPGALNAAATQGTVPETGLRYWEWRGQGILFRLTQRLPDQTRAFFLARGFAAQDADFLARKCVFQTLFQNVESPGGATIRYDLNEWSIQAQGSHRTLLTRERWDEIWTTRGAGQPARIAFEWSLLPTRQLYQPQDYNWGMTSFGLEPGSRFDLDFSWQRDGRREQASLVGVQCPEDLHPEPPQ